MGTLLVTGGGGFVMSHLVRHWTELGPGNRTVVLDAFDPDAAARGFFAPAGERIRFLKGDVADASVWERLDAQVRGLPAITHVVHGAAVTSVERLRRAGGLRGVVPAIATNVMGTAHALGFAEALPGLERFVCVSSGSVYDPHRRPVPGQPQPEDGGVGPIGFYPVSKLIGELLTGEAAGMNGAGGGLPALSVRLSGVYGPLDRRTESRDVDCAPKRILHLLRAGSPVRVSGLDAIGDYVHAGDVARGIAALLTCPAPRHPVYNIAQGEAVSLRDLLARVEEIDPALRIVEAPPEEADLVGDPTLMGGRWGAYDISRIAAETGWRPRPLADGLRDYRDWLRDHPV